MKEYRLHPKRKIMEDILAVRYTDLDKAYALCTELMTWAQDTDDLYGRAFATVYTGDYYLAQNNSKKSKQHLFQAKHLLESDKQYPELWMHLLCFIAICFDKEDDDQSAVQYYMDAIVLSTKLKDKDTEFLIYNNLAFTFQRHNNLTEALRYCQKAYALIKDMDNIQLEAVLLSNLAELLLDMERIEEAREFIEKCSQVLKDDPDAREEFGARNWCNYYSAVNDKQQAVKWAKRALLRVENYQKKKFSAFSNCHGFFQSMMHVKSKEYAKVFLDLLEEVSEDSGLDEKGILVKSKLEYALLFEPEETHLEAYRQLYKKFAALRSSGNRVIVRAMQGRLNLEEELERKDILITKQEHLTQQAYIDELSQLYNRDYLEKILRNNRFAGRNVGVVMLDIDYFKEYNDFYGHMEGDNVIRMIGCCLLENRGDNIYACRYGGDEFVCVVCDADAPAVEGFIHKVRESLRKKNISHETSLCNPKVTLSIGYATASAESDIRFPYLLQMADQALYETKLSGRNGFTGKGMDK